jgi:6-phosphogluconate dehydrogenase
MAIVSPILKRLAVEGGFVHAGAPGAGHYVKLVHNGIEFGMLQAFGEGVGLLEQFPERLPVSAILECWRHGSVIRSWLADLIAAQYRSQRGLSRIPPFIEDTGEVNWLLDDALRLEVPVPVIAQAVMQLLASRDDRRVWARAVAAMRHGFGGHPFGRDAAIARERQDSRIGRFRRPGGAKT